MRLGGAYLWIGLAAGLVIIGLLYAGKAGWLGGGNKGPEASPPLIAKDGKITIPADSPLRSRIVTAAAGSREIGAKLTLPGVVESDPGRTAAVLAPLAGRVVELKVGLGERVTQGQVLALLQSGDLAQAYDDDDKAADTLHLTEVNLARQQEQFSIGTASARDLDQAKSDHAQALAEYQRTQTRLKAINADPRDKSRLMAVKAPVAGSVTALSVAQGNMVNDPTQPLMTIADLHSVWVTAMVPEKSLGEVAKDQVAEVVLDAFPGQVLKGKVLFVADTMEPDSRRNKTRIGFNNPNFLLKPNMFATVTLQGAKKSQVVLPTSALLMNNDRTTVFVATGDWVFERRVVDLALEEGTEVGIGSGVAPGEKVVVKGGILLND